MSVQYPIVLNGTQVFYLSPTGNDNNDGLTPATPWATLTHAFNTIISNYNFALNTVWLKLADGVYTSGLNVQGRALGQGSSANFIIQGNPANPKAVLLNTTGHCIQATEAAFALSCLKLQASGANSNGMLALQGTEIVLNDVSFGACGGYHVQASYGAEITVNNGYDIDGGAQGHILAQAGSIYKGPAGSTINLSGVPNFSSAFVIADGGSYLDWLLANFVGNATGVRYSSTLNAVIKTGGGPNYFPGSLPGYTDGSGRYA